MSRHLEMTSVARLRFPRVSGDEPISVTKGAAHMEFSPRERG